MKLFRVYFDAYRSLIGTQLDFTYPCMGMVGINESGKSNILRALQVLSPKHPLSAFDRPKWDSNIDPAVRFVFKLKPSDLDTIAEGLGTPDVDAPAIKDVLDKEDVTISYHVIWSAEQKEERRFFTIDNVDLPADAYVRSVDALTRGCSARVGDDFVSLTSLVFMSADDYDSNVELHRLSDELGTLRQQQSELMDRITQMTPSDFSAKEEADAKSDQDVTAAADDGSESELTTLERDRSELESQIKELLERLGDFNQLERRAKLRSLIKRAKSEIAEQTETLTKHTGELEVMENAESPLTEDLVKRIPVAKRAITMAKTARTKAEQKLRGCEAQLEALEQPFADKFTQATEDLGIQLGGILKEGLEALLPRVVFWTHSADYVLADQTDWDDLLNAQSLADIPRPLLNLFRIAFQAQSLEDIHNVVKEIRADPSRRRSHQDKLVNEVRTYMKAVWPDYDQSVDISLEQDRIIVQIYDPNKADASYYAMNERSQGAQTFISFLLTIGAEAKHGVIRNTLLLLDEPETHLHPSGVRHMLAQLIKAAESGNAVAFATHSLFMIDKEQYDRHLIIKKEHERTQIQPSKRDRVGYFMQEEVLYGAIDSEYRAALPVRRKLNFVFEGNADAVLFEAVYRLCVSDDDRAVDLGDTEFYHGGRCSDIKKFFTQQPVPLGSKWVFVLDDDKPARDLRKFIESRYGTYIGKDVFVFDYADGERDREGFELEDLLDDAFLMTVLNEVAGELEVALPDEPRGPSEYFGVHLNRIESGLGGDVNFKGRFKERLNSQVASVANSGDAKELDAFASSYTAWAQAVAAKLFEALEEKPKKPRSKASPAKEVAKATGR